MIFRGRGKVLKTAKKQPKSSVFARFKPSPTVSSQAPRRRQKSRFFCFFRRSSCHDVPTHIMFTCVSLRSTYYTTPFVFIEYQNTHKSGLSCECPKRPRDKALHCATRIALRCTVSCNSYRKRIAQCNNALRIYLIIILFILVPSLLSHLIYNFVLLLILQASAFPHVRTHVC